MGVRGNRYATVLETQVGEVGGQFVSWRFRFRSLAIRRKERKRKKKKKK
jgi:hypothetical protein